MAQQIILVVSERQTHGRLFRRKQELIPFFVSLPAPLPKQ